MAGVSKRGRFLTTREVLDALDSDSGSEMEDDYDSEDDQDEYSDRSDEERPDRGSDSDFIADDVELSDYVSSDEDMPTAKRARTDTRHHSGSDSSRSPSPQMDPARPASPDTFRTPTPPT